MSCAGRQPWRFTKRQAAPIRPLPGTLLFRHWHAPRSRHSTAASGVGIDKVLTGAGYNCQTVTGAAEANRFLDAQSAAKPFLLIAGFAPYQSAADAKYLVPYAQSKFDTWPQEPAAKNAARNRETM